MGRIENPLFHDRVELGKSVIKEIVRDYTDLIFRGNSEDAAEKLGLKSRTYYAYLGGEKASLPTEIFYSVIGSLGLKPETFDFKRKSLTEIQRKSLVDVWKSNREHMLDEAKKASVSGIKNLEKIYGDDWRNDVAQIAREGWKRKYGNEWGKYFSSIGQKKAIEKFGADWRQKSIKKASEALGRKYGKDGIKKLCSDANKKLREEYGENFQIDYLKILYGQNWLDVIHGFQWQRKNFQNFSKEEMGSLFSFIADKTGYEGIKIVGLLLQNENLSTGEISERSKNTVKYTRQLLYKLANSGIVNYKIIAYEPEEERVYVNTRNLKQKAVSIKEDNKKRIVSYLEENKNFFACTSENCGFKTSFEKAFDIGFHCPSCNSLLNMGEPPKILKLIERKIK